MRRRQWSSQEKFRIVLEGLSGQIDISDLCKKHKISQTLFCRWRDHFLQCGHQAFERPKKTQGEELIRKENKRLKHVLDAMTAELKKIDSGLKT